MAYRENRPSGGGWKGPKGPRKFDSGDRGAAPFAMHSTTCSECGKSCEVPFKPNGRKPVFCGACYHKDGNGEQKFHTNENHGGGGDFEVKQMHKATCEKCGKTCEVPFKPSGKKPVFCSQCFGGETTTSENRRSEPSVDPLRLVNAKLDTILRLLKQIAPETMTDEERVMNEVKESKKKKATIDNDGFSL